MQHLTFDILLTLLGQTIRWSAPSSSENRPYGGISRISGIVASYRPILGETIEGDMLSIARVDDAGRLVYSDDFRFITFQIVKL
jgi:hypothetical protein